ncbi:MAG: hypothetical protein ACSHX8_14150 [Opitutaceae bacterium]
MKKEKILSALAAIALTAGIGLLLAILSTEFFELYGSGIFIATPIVCGAISVLIYNRTGQKKLGESIFVSFLSGGFSLLGFLVVGFEGLICLAMAIPVMLPLYIIGGFIAFPLSKAIGRKLYGDIVSILLIAFVPIFMGFESRQPYVSQIRDVTSTVIITGDIDDVWHEVIAFSHIPEPTEFLFKIGIAYPTHAEIKGVGVGAVRHCNFSTGTFVEPITHWEVNKRLAFSVSEQPVPMTEMSLYPSIHPPHLDWALRSERGQFLLTDLGNGTIQLSGTTWFHVQMEPEPYWGWLSDHIIHLIHKRVLNHIKHTVETTEQQSNHKT